MLNSDIRVVGRLDNQQAPKAECHHRLKQAQFSVVNDATHSSHRPCSRTSLAIPSLIMFTIDRQALFHHSRIAGSNVFRFYIDKKTNKNQNKKTRKNKRSNYLKTAGTSETQRAIICIAALSDSDYKSDPTQRLHVNKFCGSTLCLMLNNRS